MFNQFFTNLSANKRKIFLSLAALIVSFAFGRYSAPVKIKTVIKTVEVEKKQDKTKSNYNKGLHKKTLTKEIIKPDGTKEITTETTVDTQTNKKTDSNSSTQTDVSQTATKEIVKSSSLTSVSLFGGANVLNPTGGFDFGLGVSHSIIGPINIGLYGFKSGAVGGSVGVSF